MTEKKECSYEWWWIFFPIGILLGAGAGFLLGSISLGLILGAALGTPLNLIFYYQYRTTQLDSDAD